MPYVDGFVIAVPREKLDAYKERARTAGAVWMEKGALSYVERLHGAVNRRPHGDAPVALARAARSAIVEMRWRDG